MKSYLIRKALSILTLGLFFAANALAEDVVLKSAKFDANGKLKVVLNHPGIEGCYLTVYAGLNKTDLETAIIGIQASTENVAADTVTIKTKRKYYCQRRTLFVEVQRLCYDDLSLTSTSEVLKVNVPSSNVRK